VDGLNRRGFLKAAGAATTGTLLGTRLHALGAGQSEVQSEGARPVAANDHIQIALSGAQGSRSEAGGRGGLL
jgi:hypothetical protein